MVKKNQKHIRNGHELAEDLYYEKFASIAAALVAGIIPLIVYLHVAQVPNELRTFWIQAENFDFFSWWKARLLLVIAVLVLPIITIKISRIKNELKNPCLIMLGVFMLIVVLSGVSSAYPNIAWWGYFDRYEGALIWLAYGVLLLFAFLFTKSMQNVEKFAVCIVPFVLLLSLMGLGQFFGADIFRTLFGRHMILPAQYDHIAPYLNFTFGQYTIYATLYNTNYVGSYMALFFPASFVFFMYAKGKIAFYAGVISALFFAVQLGCNSRAGYVGVVAAFFVIAIIMLKKLLKDWKKCVLIGCVYFLILGSINLYSGGTILHRATEIKVNKLAGVEIEPETTIEKLVVKYGGFASGRGYIWLRSFEMMKDTILIGHGADTYTLFFPKNDAFKGYGGLEQSVMVDKPHNMYLQIGINFGVVALILFIVMFMWHIISTLKRIGFMHGENEKVKIYAFMALVSVIAYLVANIFNDSIVSVAPVFWIVTGLSLALSDMVKEGRLIGQA